MPMTPTNLRDLATKGWCFAAASWGYQGVISVADHHPIAALVAGSASLWSLWRAIYVQRERLVVDLRRTFLAAKLGVVSLDL